MLNRRLSGIFCQFCSVLAVLSLANLVGCGAAATPAEFQGGGGANALDNAVISDDGNTMTIILSDDGTALQSVEISTPEGDELVAFRNDTANGTAVPSQITTARGNSVEIDESGTARVTTTLPLQTEPTTFTFDIGSNPFEQLSARVASQSASDCEGVRDTIDSFCDFFESNGDAAKQELIDVAIELVLLQVDESLAGFVPGLITDLIEDIFDTIEVVCNGWSEMRTGTDETVAVDPCS